MEAQKAGRYDKGQMGQSLSGMANRGELGLADQGNRNTSGSRQESWLTPKSRDYRGVENHILRNGKNIRATGQVFSVGLPTQAMMEEQKSWATPNTMDCLPPKSPEALARNLKKGGCRNLREDVVYRVGTWATPRAGATDNSRPNNKGGIPLGDQCRREGKWATPQARDYKSGEDLESWSKRAEFQKQKGVNLHLPLSSQSIHVEKSQGKLNPRWVETLMGLPVGWVMPSCVNPITPIAEPMQSMGQQNWNTPNVMDTITPTRDLTKTPMKGHWGKSMNTGKLSEQVMQTGGNWMTPEAQNSTGYQVSNGKKILRLGSQVMDTSTSPVTTEPTNSDSSEMELFQQQQNSLSELSGRN